MSKQNEGNVLFLTIGKEVKLNFDEADHLASIRLSINKIAEIVGNGLVNEESIFDVSIVGLITKSNYKTYIQVVGGRQVMHGNTNYEKIPINQKRTYSRKGNRDVYQQGFFEFYVKEGEKIPKRRLILPYNR
ncbi:hypothetical protein FQS87_08125 [Enterococcus avium]|uniref:hypothetical protein n=1 Tax=Enterococcus TaxID=1350 RepID=UPI001A95A2A7|nr:hypothetical protein [Enterococcus avium]MBO1139861.1 hypothetical protein [Enterococcus avium]